MLWRHQNTRAQPCELSKLQIKILDYLISQTPEMPLAGKTAGLDGKRAKRDIRDFYIFKDKLGTWVFHFLVLLIHMPFCHFLCLPCCLWAQQASRDFFSSEKRNPVAEWRIFCKISEPTSIYNLLTWCFLLHGKNVVWAKISLCCLADQGFFPQCIWNHFFYLLFFFWRGETHPS